MFCDNLTDVQGNAYVLEEHTDSSHGDVCRRKGTLEWLCPHCCQVSRLAPYCVARPPGGTKDESPSQTFSTFAALATSSNRSPYGGRYGASNTFGFDFKHHAPHGKLCRVTAIRDPARCVSKTTSFHVHSKSSGNALAEHLRISALGGALGNVLGGVSDALWHHHRHHVSDSIINDEVVALPSSRHELKLHADEGKSLAAQHDAVSKEDIDLLTSGNETIEEADLEESHAPSIFDSLGTTERSSTTATALASASTPAMSSAVESRTQSDFENRPKKEHKFVGPLDSAGKPHGKGVIAYTSGAQYSGIFKHGKRHGKVMV